VFFFFLSSHELELRAKTNHLIIFNHHSLDVLARVPRKYPNPPNLPSARNPSQSVVTL
jgi:hypothetical protein